MSPTVGLDLSCLEVSPETGVERYARCIAEHLPRVAPELNYVALVRAGRTAPNMVDTGSVAAVKSTLPRALWREFQMMPAALKAGVQVFHSPVASVPMRCPVPRMVTIHDLGYRMDEATLGRNVRNRLRLHHALGVARRIIVPSETTKSGLLKLDPAAADHIRVIPHGVDSDFRPTGLPLNRETYKLPKDAPFLLWVGTVRQRKDPLVLMRAFARLSRDSRFKTLHLLVCGDLRMPEDMLREPLEGTPGQGRLLLHGYAAREDLPDLYREADAVVIPSLMEGFGLTALEAMSCGTPLVVSQDPALKSLTGSAALSFDTGDAEALAQTLKKLLDHPAARAGLKAEARIRSKDYSWEAAARRHAAVYAELVSEASLRASI